MYALIDPRDLKTFYIGKGKADRRFRSLRNIPDKTTGKKSQRIKEIEDAGLQVQAVVASWHDDEEEAYEAERQKIAEVGLETLTNMKVGGNGRQADRGKKENALTPKQEKFAQLVASGVNQSDAYREAYNTSGKASGVHVNSAKLVADTKISLRIAELRQPAVKKVGLTVETLLSELEQAQALARDTDNANGMTQAIMAKAKLADLLPSEKKELHHHDATRLEERLQAGRDNIIKLRNVKNAS